MNEREKEKYGVDDTVQVAYTWRVCRFSLFKVKIETTLAAAAPSKNWNVWVPFLLRHNILLV